MWNCSAGNDGAEKLGAGGILESFETATKRVEKAVMRSFVSEIAFDLVAKRVIGDVSDDFVWRGPLVADVG